MQAVFEAMEKIKDYDVSFAGLSLGQHEYDFGLTQSFFDLFEFDRDFDNPDLNIHLTLDKKNNFLDLIFELSGTVELLCDITSEPYKQELEGESEIVVKFGTEYDFSDDEVWVIPQAEHKFNIAQMIYEMTLLAIPMKRIHPDVESGKSHSEMLDLLERYGLRDAEETESNESGKTETDPRWEALKKLKNK